MHSYPESKPFGTWSYFLEDLKKQEEEALGNDNRLFFYRENGYLPTDEQAKAHYENHGGPEAFIQAHSKTG